MYCPSCGVAVVPSLSYCNHCGANLTPSVPARADVKPEILVQGMIMVFVFGLAAISVLLGVMKAVLNLNEGAILGFAALSFFIMMVVEGVFIGLLVRRKHKPEQSNAKALSKQQTNELDAAQERVLTEPASVTDHTTRAFDPIYTNRR